MANGPYINLYFMAVGIFNNENCFGNGNGNENENKFHIRLYINGKKMVPCGNPEVRQALWGQGVTMKVCDKNGVWYLNRKYKKGKDPNTVGFTSGFSGKCSISDFFYNKTDLDEIHIKSSTLRTGTSVLFRRGNLCECYLK